LTKKKFFFIVLFGWGCLEKHIGFIYFYNISKNIHNILDV
jgi:hypothetical protein